MKRMVVSFVTLVLLAAPQAYAGKIFGDIKADGKPLPAGVVVRISKPVAPDAKTAPATADTTVTDKFGAYKLQVAEEGKCILSVVLPKGKETETVELAVFSYKEATRYNLIVETVDGKRTLKRR